MNNGKAHTKHRGLVRAVLIGLVLGVPVALLLRFGFPSDEASIEPSPVSAASTFDPDDPRWRDALKVDPARQQRYGEHLVVWPRSAEAPAIALRVNWSDQMLQKRLNVVGAPIPSTGDHELRFNVTLPPDAIARPNLALCDFDKVTEAMFNSNVRVPLACRGVSVLARLTKEWPGPIIRQWFTGEVKDERQEHLPFDRRIATFKGEYVVTSDAQTGASHFAGWVCGMFGADTIAGLSDDRTALRIAQSRCDMEQDGTTKRRGARRGIDKRLLRVVCAPDSPCVAYTLFAGRVLALTFERMAPAAVGHAVDPALQRALAALSRMSASARGTVTPAGWPEVKEQLAVCALGVEEAGRWKEFGNSRQLTVLRYHMSLFEAVCTEAGLRAVLLFEAEPKSAAAETLRTLEEVSQAHDRLRFGTVPESPLFSQVAIDAATADAQGPTVATVRALRAHYERWQGGDFRPEKQAERDAALQRAIDLAIELLPASIAELHDLLWIERNAWDTARATPGESANHIQRLRQRVHTLADMPAGRGAALLCALGHLANQQWQAQQFDALRETAARMHATLLATRADALAASSAPVGSILAQFGFDTVLYARIFAFRDQQFDPMRARARETIERMQGELGASDKHVRAARFHLGEIEAKRAVPNTAIGGGFLGS